MKLTKKIKSAVRELRSYIPKSLPDLSTTWTDKNIPAQQWQVASKELAEMNNGAPPTVFAVAADLLRMLPVANKLSFLDVACGCGYYSEVISHLVPELKIHYIGGDFSEAMLSEAKRHCAEGRFRREDVMALSFDDKSVDVVFSSATIDHIRDYRVGLRELARVSKSWLVLHRLGIARRGKSIVESQHHYGVDVYVNHISYRELIQEMDTLGYELVAEKVLSKRCFAGRQGMSFLFKRKE